MTRLIGAGLFVLLLLLPVGADAQSHDYGTRRDAMMMLQRVIGALLADETKALEMMRSGAPGFSDRDLYPYCGGPDGMMTAHPYLMGQNLRYIVDKRGNPLGEELYSVAKEGEITEFTYYWPRPGTTEILQKIALVTKVGDQVCAVGYYRSIVKGRATRP
jgi:hypothetical protein